MRETKRVILDIIYYQILYKWNSDQWLKKYSQKVTTLLRMALTNKFKLTWSSIWMTLC